MQMSVRIVSEAPAEPFVSVDGALPGQGLELSHWPGHRTPEALRHELSTGAALAFAALDAGERKALVGDATSFVNNHYDTDGICALFAASRPEAARGLAPRLLGAAAAGDFFSWPDDEAVAFDLFVACVADPKRSPIAEALGGRSNLERWNLATQWLLEHMETLLAPGGLEIHGDCWRPALEAMKSDRGDLESVRRDDLVHLDLCIWIPKEIRPSSRKTPPTESFDPGRHALFGSARCDRALVLAPAEGGTTARLILSTRSWFDLPNHTPLDRPDLEALAARLNELEGTTPDSPEAWRTQDPKGASPELWFGTPDAPLYSEHAPYLRPSQLDPAKIRAEVTESMRATLVLPDD